MRSALWLVGLLTACAGSEDPSTEPDAGSDDAGSTHDGGSAPEPDCWNDPPLPAESDILPAPSVMPNNPTSAAGAALGRRLFYDPRLSTNGQVSCATCHEPDRAFSIDEALTARGVSGQALPRHAPTLFNLAWVEVGFFWDGGSKNLESQAIAPLIEPNEMGHVHGLHELIEQLSALPSYVAQFEHAFGSDGMTYGNLARALAQFQRTIISDQSRWDQRERGQATFTPEQAAGEAVFQRECARCHVPGLFTDDGFHNNGLDETFGDDPIAVSRGRERVSLDEADLGKFRTPSLRNVTLSAPYMHDGRLGSLNEVIAHYRHGMKPSPTLDPGFIRGEGSFGVEITDDEAIQLERFLEALTDHELAARFGPLATPQCP